MEADKIVYLAPEQILAESETNTRFGLKKLRVESLGEDIIAAGGVQEPITVIALDKPKNGVTHRLLKGFYRHAAVTLLNKEQAADLKLPAIVREAVDPIYDLRRQLAENVERENLSPMDQAVAIKRLMDAGVTRIDVRNIFRRPGGRKGLSNQPLSNALVNIYLGFLELPKAIQEKIHDGRVGVAAAYELGRVSPDRRADILERAEDNRQAEMDKDEKDEKKFLESQKKVETAAEEAVTKASELVAAKAALETAAALEHEKLKEVGESYLKTQAPGLDDKDRKAAKEHHKAVETDHKGLQKATFEAKKAVEKLENQTKTAASKADEARKRLENARKARKTGGSNRKAVAVTDVKKAAQEAGEASGFVALNASQMRDALKDIMKNAAFKKVAAITEVFQKIFSGEHTPKIAMELLAEITGEAPKVQRAKR